MKSALVILLASSILGIAVLSFFIAGCMGMDCLLHKTHVWCIVAQMTGGCPAVSNFLASVNFHLDVLKGVSTAIFGKTLVVVLILLVFITAFLPSGAFKKNYILISSAGTLPPLPKFQIEIFARLRRWLALHQKRDRHASFRMHDRSGPYAARTVAAF